MILQTRLITAGCEPTRANPTDAGLDLKVSETVFLVPNQRKLVKTGVSVKIPPNHVGLLFPRSSLSKKGLSLTNSVGVIDSDYRGEIMASMTFSGYINNTGPHITLKLEKGERIVQLVVVPIVLPTVEIQHYTDQEWSDTARGTGGFGSTGTN